MMTNKKARESMMSAIAAIEGNRLSEAKGILRCILENIPNHARARAALSRVLLIEKDAEGALLEAKRARATKPTLSLPYLIIAKAMLSILETKEARNDDAISEIVAKGAATDEEGAYALNFANVLTTIKRHDQSAKLLERAASRVRSVSDSLKLLYRAGQCYSRSGKKADASRCWAEVAKHSGAPASLVQIARFKMIALSAASSDGEYSTPSHAPEVYVKRLYDSYAATFDEQLGKLSYRTPEIVRDLLVELASTRKTSIETSEGRTTWKRCIDLGCGTGLSGLSLRPFVNRMSGVDLSTKMIDRAREREIYDDLCVDDITRYLSEKVQSCSVDLVVSCDVFVYIGDLSKIFELVSSVLREGGVFAFSTESLSCEDKRCTLGANAQCESRFLLSVNKRFKHCSKYIVQEATNLGFRLVKHADRRQLRRQGGKPVLGDVFVFERTVDRTAAGNPR